LSHNGISVGQSGVYRLLTTRLNEEELRTVCFALPVDYDSLGGEGKAGKARELILYCQARRLNGRLLKMVLSQRPDLVSEVAITPGKTGPLGIVPSPGVPVEAFRAGYDAFIAHQIEATHNLQLQQRVTWGLIVLAIVLMVAILILL
jgi:hypothetical protein